MIEPELDARTPNWNTQGAKDDTGKYRPSLVPPDAIKAIAIVREYGSQKYKSDDNWQEVSTQRFLDALLRHALELVQGNDIDPESNLPHAYHVATNAAFIAARRMKNP